MTLLEWLIDGTIPVAGSTLRVPEVVGNVFGLGSALLGMRRVMWAWPVGLVGNVILFFVYTSGSIIDVGGEGLWGQALRQVFFASVSVYGWWRWGREKRRGAGEGHAAITVRWATWRERALLVAVGVVGYFVARVVLDLIGSWNPATEAWIAAGSMLATWGMARGWVEFWLVWILVDVVGVWSLWNSPYDVQATIAMYLFYAFFVVIGFFTWWRAAARHDSSPHVPVAEPVGTVEEVQA